MRPVHVISLAALLGMGLHGIANAGQSSPSAKESAWHERWVKEYWVKEEARQRKLHADAAERAKATPATPPSTQNTMPSTSASNPAGIANDASKQASAVTAPAAKSSVDAPSQANPAGTAQTHDPAPVKSSASVSATSGRRSAAPASTAGVRRPAATAASPKAMPVPGSRAQESVNKQNTASSPAQTALPPAVPAAPAPSHAAVKSSGSPAEVDLSHTKPDLIPAPDASNHTIESPLQAVGDGWKMVAYLLPTLIFVLVCLNLLRRYQQKNGRLPAGLQKMSADGGRSTPVLAGALATLFSGNNSSPRNGGSGNNGIRLVESLNVGGGTLHLVHVHGRTLLLAGGAGGVTVLTEFTDIPSVDSDDFQKLLRSAAADMDGLDLQISEMPVSAVVGSLEDVMRDTGGSLERRLRRLRTVREAEDGGEG